MEASCVILYKGKEGGGSMRKLLILDPFADYVQYLQERLGDVCQIIACSQYDSALDIITHVDPDYMILDLTASEFEGFTLLRAALALGANPAVIGISQSSAFYAAMCAREKNITSTVSRPINQEIILSRLSLMMELPMDQMVPIPTRTEVVGYTLNALGIPGDWLGRRNLIDIIPMAADHPELSYTKHLYPEAAKRSGNISQNVERNIRTAIEYGWSHGNRAVWAQYFPADQNGFILKPCNSEFISVLAQVLNLQRGQYREEC